MVTQATQCSDCLHCYQPLPIGWFSELSSSASSITSVTLPLCSVSWMVDLDHPSRHLFVHTPTSSHRRATALVAVSHHADMPSDWQSRPRSTVAARLGVTRLWAVHHLFDTQRRAWPFTLSRSRATTSPTLFQQYQQRTVSPASHLIAAAMCLSDVWCFSFTSLKPASAFLSHSLTVRQHLGQPSQIGTVQHVRNTQLRIGLNSTSTVLKCRWHSIWESGSRTRHGSCFSSG